MTPVPENRRLDLPRVSRRLDAMVRIGSRRQACTVEDASPNGVGLKITGGVLLPSHFDLVLGGEALPVSLVWREGDRVGVAFMGSTSAAVTLRRRLLGL